MEVVGQCSIEVSGGEAQAVHRTAEGCRCQWEGLQGKDKSGKSIPAGSWGSPNAGFPGLVPRDRGHSRLPPALSRRAHSQCGPWKRALGSTRPACGGQDTYMEAGPLAAVPQSHNTIVGGASGQQVVPIRL